MEGIVGITGSRNAIRQAFNKGLISNGNMWMQMIVDRILTVHTYNEETAEEIKRKIYNQYFDVFEAFYSTMREKL